MIKTLAEYKSVISWLYTVGWGATIETKLIVWRAVEDFEQEHPELKIRIRLVV